MSRPMEKGDTVTVHWVEGVLENVTVIHMPAGAGDLMQVLCEDGTLYAINTCASHLDSIIRRTPAPEAGEPGVQDAG